MPIYLCVKIHTKTNLKYFCKTATRNPYTYKGSGIHWLRHIKLHGKELVKTLKVWSFNDEQSATEFALKFSKDNNIVISKHWANLQEENALDGWIPGQKRPSITGDNNPSKRLDVKEKLSKNNPMKRPDVVRKLSESTKGISKPWQKGQNNNACRPEVAAKISVSLTGKQQLLVKCQHCGKTGGISNMKRYHLDNCKQK